MIILSASTTFQIPDRLYDNVFKPMTVYRSGEHGAIYSKPCAVGQNMSHSMNSIYGCSDGGPVSRLHIVILDTPLLHSSSPHAESFYLKCNLR